MLVKINEAITLHETKFANRKKSTWSFSVYPMNIGTYRGSYEKPEEALKAAMDYASDCYNTMGKTIRAITLHDPKKELARLLAEDKKF
jgi:hypothetical protein